MTTGLLQTHTSARARARNNNNNNKTKKDDQNIVHSNETLKRFINDGCLRKHSSRERLKLTVWYWYSDSCWATNTRWATGLERKPSCSNAIKKIKVTNDFRIWFSETSEKAGSLSGRPVVHDQWRFGHSNSSATVINTSTS